jgi:hypothetical protein
MKDSIEKKLKEMGYRIRKPRSMPFGCNRETRIYIPDILAVSGDDIHIIVEPESGTGGTPICGKIVLANRSIELMMNDGTQSRNIKPRLVFLYKKSFPSNSLRRVKYRVERANIDRPYLSEVIIDYFPAGWNWIN